MFNSVVQPASFLVYKKNCHVAKAKYSVAMDIQLQFVCINWYYFELDISYQHSNLLDHAVQIAPFLVYKKVCSVSRVQ